MSRFLSFVTLAPAVALAAASAAAQDADAARLPELPREVPTLPAVVARRTIRPATADELQAALDRARGGDVIALAPGVRYVGSFRLRRRADAGWVVIQGPVRAEDRGVRVQPADSAALPTLELGTDNGGVIRAEKGAGYYRFINVEITAPATARSLNALVRLDAGNDSTLAAQPHHIVFERAYIHGQPGLDFTRCVIGNAAWMVVVDSYLSDCHGRRRDTQAFSAWSSPGPFLLQNNYLEGAGENVLIGGATPRGPGLVPSDITIRNNYFYKPRAWKGVWTVKNLLEIKQGQRVLIEGNVLRNVWKDAQTGRALLVRAADQHNPRRPWARTRDVTIRRNWIDSTVSPVNLDAEGPVERLHDVRLEGNLMTNATGAALQVTGPIANLAIVRNTSLVVPGSRAGGVTFDGVKPGFVFVDNLFAHGGYGVKASGVAPGAATLARNAPGARLGGNVWIGERAARGLGDAVVPSVDAAPAGVGADTVAVRRAVAGVVEGRPAAGG